METSVSQTDVVKLPERIRVLNFATNFVIGGTERHLVNLAEGIDHFRFELHFACLKRFGDFLKDIESTQVPLSEFRINSVYGLHTLKQQVSFARYLRRNRIQIVHSYNFYANVFAIPAARLACSPVVVASIRDLGPYLSPAQKRAQRFICSFADHILVNAEAVSRWLIQEGYNPAKISVINNGVDLARFSTRHRAARLRQELGLAADAPLVAMLCRLNRVKRVEDFLEAAAVVAKRFKETRFLVIGDDFLSKNGAAVRDCEYRSQLEGQAARLGLTGRLFFTGYRLDIAEILSEIAISVLPSDSEAFSNALLESMAAGIPVVATNVGGNSEVVEDGVTGLLVAPRDPAALARAICLLLENDALAHTLGHAGKRRVAERFSLAQMIRSTEAFYFRLLQRAACEG